MPCKIEVAHSNTIKWMKIDYKTQSI